MKTKLNDLFYSEWNVDPFSLCINIFRYKWFDNDTGKGLLHTPIKRLIFHCQLLRWSVYFHFFFQWHISFVYIREFGLPQVACGCQVGHAHTADLMEKRGHVLTQRGERLTHFGQTRNRLQEKVNSLLVLQHCKKINIFGLFSSQYVSKVKLYDYQKNPNENHLLDYYQLDHWYQYWSRYQGDNIGKIGPWPWQMTFNIK